LRNPSGLRTDGYADFLQRLRQRRWGLCTNRRRRFNRLSGWNFQGAAGTANKSTTAAASPRFLFPGANPADPNIQVDTVRIKQELEQGYATQYPQMHGCANLTVIYAKIFYGYPIGISSRDVAGGLLVVMGSAPIDHTAADATHNYLLQAAKARDLAQKQKAQQNKPAL
jgi:hypothetical protein